MDNDKKDLQQLADISLSYVCNDTIKKCIEKNNHRFLIYVINCALGELTYLKKELMKIQ